jgi:hypothetical protein
MQPKYYKKTCHYQELFLTCYITTLDVKKYLSKVLEVCHSNYEECSDPY